MKQIIKLILSITLIFVVGSCGKRGDLLPPPGYENLSNNS